MMVRTPSPCTERPNGTTISHRKSGGGRPPELERRNHLLMDIDGRLTMHDAIWPRPISVSDQNKSSPVCRRRPLTGLESAAPE